MQVPAKVRSHFSYFGTIATIPPSWPPNLTQQKTRAVPGKEIKKMKNFTHAEKLEIVKLVENGQSKSFVEAKFGINKSTEEND